jgi:hypothetical protein
LIDWKKVAGRRFFRTVASLPPAKGVTFAGFAGALLRPGGRLQQCAS